jgi:hypothetical protein
MLLGSLATPMYFMAMLKAFSPATKYKNSSPDFQSRYFFYVSRHSEQPFESIEENSLGLSWIPVTSTDREKKIRDG